jgi:hypothetical protein
VPLPHDDVWPSDEASRASLAATPRDRAWFYDDDTCADVDHDVPANQTDDDATDL